MAPWIVFSVLAILSAPLAAESARAQASGNSAGPGAPASSDQPAAQPPSDSIQGSLGPIGDPVNLRGTLAENGISYSLIYIGEVLGNVSGGQRRGAIYEGRLDGQLDIDLGRAIDWTGATFHANFYQIHGPGLSRDYLGNLLTVSGIEALPATRLYEAWIEQEWLGGSASLRAGQLAADAEFVVSQYAALFVNSTFGFPGLLAANLPNGGPAYPLATPGVRAKLKPDENWSTMIGVFNGAPAGMRATNPQRDDRNGLEFRTDDPALVMAEVAYSYDAGVSGTVLPGTAKLGAWGHLGRFDDLRVARRLPGNAGGYLVIDQVLHRVPGTENGGLGAFVRILGAPGDRNLLSFYVDGGLTFKGVIPGRPDDTVGIGLAYAQISDSVRSFNADLAALNLGGSQVVRKSEAALELTYQAQIVPGWTVQPTLQYIRRPGGGVVDPASASGQRLKDATVLGVRSSTKY